MISFHRNNNIFKGNNALLKLPHTTHFNTPFFIKKPPKNGYITKQTTHFSITPLRPKFFFKKFFQNQQNAQFGTLKKTLKKCPSKSQAKPKPSFL